MPTANAPRARSNPADLAGQRPAGEQEAPSILFPAGEASPGLAIAQPACFRDLNLDQVVASLLQGREVHDLAAFFHTPLGDADAVAFRHEVLRDLRAGSLATDLRAFAGEMQAVRTGLALAEKFEHPYQRDAWLLRAINTDCRAAARLAADLAEARLDSRALRAVRRHVAAHVASEAFRTRRSEGAELAGALSAIRYDILVQGLRVQVRKAEPKPDLGSEVQKTFEPFRQGDVEPYPFRFDDSLYANRIEGEVLHQVGALHEPLFSRIGGFCQAAEGARDPGLVKFDRELQFYFSYLDYIAPLEAAGLVFSLPEIGGLRSFADEAFDLALAAKLVRAGRTPVLNDMRLEAAERLIVVGGPNQGGKTTYARMFGQLHYLAALGLPVPAARAGVRLFDRLFTHFERQERVADLRGKLQDDLIRVRDILEAATGESIVVINEIFASTALRDATRLSTAIAERILALGARCVWVTFIEDLATLGPAVASVVSTVEPQNPAVRTFKLVRRAPDGLAYALSIAQKHGLTYGQILERAVR